MARLSEEASNAGGGIGIGTAFTLLFVGLKLTGYIEWSWLWVLAPLWGPIAFVAVVIVIYVLCMLIKTLIED